MLMDEKDYLAHYGILRKSGRYPWGSGGDQNTRNRTFLEEVARLKSEGLSETEIARGFGITTTQMRAAKSIAVNQQKQAQIDMAQRLKDKGYSNVAIGQRMGINESSVRSLLEPGRADRAAVLETTANMLQAQVDKKGYVDIGLGVENHVGVSKDKLAVAAAMLQEKGYEIHTLKIDQLGTGEQTTVKVLAPPGTTQKDVWANRDKIQQVSDYSDDGGRTYLNIQPPQNLSSSRVKVQYAENGGADADGVIYIRRGVEDLSMGGSNYAQVRIAVDGTHYLKGMAIYNDNMPKGVDVVFNTNKSDEGDPKKAMKPLKDDPDNPFGATIDRQSGVLNIVNEEGDWGEWSKSLSSQMLSKQSPKLAKEQLDMTYESRKQQLNDIKAMTNPAVRAKLLQSYADDVDSASVHLKAAALPRQASHVILPVASLKPNEVYAPNYRNGESVVLIRYPHGGTFEIPELKVNNRHEESRALLGKAKDAIGINAKVAERLSGADFDGDTVLVIPNNGKKVKSTPALEALKDFDPKRSYPLPEGTPFRGNTQQLMGSVSNLITDMTIRGASTSELARAVKHSMVVIDAEKHKLDHRQSAIDNGIPALKAKYQGRADKGASTLISRAGSEERVRERKQGYRIDPVTGKKVYQETGRTYTDEKGNVQFRTKASKKLAETDDAHTLSSGTPVEKIYADHSNRLKDLGNEARKAMVSTKATPWSPSAKVAYSKEVKSLDSALNIALRNAPLERQAQLIAGSVVAQKRRANPDMTKAEIKKLKGQALAAARVRTGAGKQRIHITDAQWSAIQAGAISPSKLSKILANADLDRVKDLATPKRKLTMSSVKTQRAKSMLSSGYTQAEVADALGVSLTTLKTAIA